MPRREAGLATSSRQHLPASPGLSAGYSGKGGGASNHRLYGGDGGYGEETRTGESLGALCSCVARVPISRQGLHPSATPPDPHWGVLDRGSCP